MKIEVEMDTKEIEKAFKNMGSKAKKCVERAERDAGRRGKKILITSMTQYYNAKRSDVVNHMNVKDGSIEVTGHMLTIGDTHFSIAPKVYQSQKGIKVGKRKKMRATIIRKNRKLFPHAFIMNPERMRAGKGQRTSGINILWERKGDRLRPIKTISMAHMASQVIKDSDIEKEMAKVFDERFNNQLEREMAK